MGEEYTKACLPNPVLPQGGGRGERARSCVKLTLESSLRPVMTNALQIVLVLLASAVLVVAACRLVNLPPQVGYLVAGVAIGPHALGLIPDPGEAGHLAEFGVVFLMFSVGLEFSLAKLYQMRRLVFGLGFAQVLLTTAGAVLVLTLAGFGWAAALVLGGALAMSSTAIVARMLSERMHLETPHGREVMGILLFQDLAVVPFLVIIPALASGGVDLGWHLASATGKAAVILIVLLFAGQKLMRSWFRLVARRRSQELFMLNVLLITLFLAWLTELAGLSLALGAFVAGMLIAETEFRHQVETDIKPFRDVLLGLFFVTVGMQLDLRIVGAGLPLVLFFSVVPVLFKFGLVALLSRAFGSGPGTALRTGLALAQAGEFGLVLISLAAGFGVLENEFAQIVTASMLLSLISAPFIIHYSDRLVMRWSASEWMTRSLELHRIAVQGISTERHVVVCGYGRTGQRLAHLLEQAGIGYIALDTDPERVSEAAAAGESVVFGDSGRVESLIAAGVQRASALVITFADTREALKILSHVRALNPSLPVVVRTLDDGDLDRLIAGGAEEVVPETFESSLMLASHTLVLVGVPLRKVMRQVQNVRDRRYSLLRGYFRGETDLSGSADEDRELRLHSVPITGASHSVGVSLADLKLGEIDVTVTLLRRRGVRIPSPAGDTLLEEGDVLVVLGNRSSVNAAEMRLIQGA